MTELLMTELVRKGGARLRSWAPGSRILLVLGSGLSDFEGVLEGTRGLSFDELGLPGTGVAGHRGAFLSGTLRGVPLLLQSGRFHLYEGHPLSIVTAPLQMAALAGVGGVILTNAAGGLRTEWEPGELILLRDYIDLTAPSLLVLPRPIPSVEPPREPPTFDEELCGGAQEVAACLGLSLREGCYAGVLGPAYETPAEVRMLRLLGADLVGMSTVPEVIAARALGLRVAGVSLVTNRAAGLTPFPLRHEEVLEMAALGGRRLGPFLEDFVPVAHRILASAD